MLNDIAAHQKEFFFFDTVIVATRAARTCWTS